MNKLEDHFGRWKNREEIAEAMIPMIGKLHREKNVTTTVYSRSLVNKSVIQILKAHRFVKQVEDSELSVVDSFPILQEVNKLDLGPCRIDIGKLAVEYKKDNRGLSVEDYVREELAEAVAWLRCWPSWPEARTICLWCWPPTAAVPSTWPTHWIFTWRAARRR